jgi:sec-independent protein translocase protein TatB
VLNFGPEKLFLVGVIALIVLGPNRLPQAARTLGHFVAHVRRMSNSFQQEVKEALSEPTEAVTSAVSDFRVPDLRRSVRDAVSSTFSAPVTPVPPTDSLPASPPAPPLTAGDLAPVAPDDPSLN